MFFLWPIGHEDSHRGLPWVTGMLIAVCGLMYAYTGTSENKVMKRLAMNAFALEATMQDWPW